MKKITAIVVAILMLLPICVSAESAVFSKEALSIMTDTIYSVYSQIETEEDIKDAFLKAWAVSASAEVTEEEISAAGHTAFNIINYIQNKNTDSAELSIEEVVDLTQTTLNSEYFETMAKEGKASFSLNKLLDEAEDMTKTTSKASDARVEAVKKELLSVCAEAAKKAVIAYGAQIPEKYAEYAALNFGKIVNADAISSLFDTIRQYMQINVTEVAKASDKTWNYVEIAAAYANAVLLSENASPDDINAAYNALYYAATTMSAEIGGEYIVTAQGKTELISFAEGLLTDEYERVVTESSKEVMISLLERIKAADDSEAAEALYLLCVQAAREVVDAEIDALSNYQPVNWTDLTGGFSDVNRKDWSFPAIYLTTQNNLIKGVENNFFGKFNETTVGEFMGILKAFAEGTDSADFEGGAVWAKENNILENIETLDMSGAITREQAVSAIYNMFKVYGVVSEVPEASYADMADTADYAKDAMCWALDGGIIKGNGDGNLLPKTVLSRECAAQLMLNVVIYINTMLIY